MAGSGTGWFGLRDEFLEAKEIDECEEKHEAGLQPHKSFTSSNETDSTISIVNTKE